jgi:hypothetical protein
MNDINIVAVVLATLAQFGVGAIWYMPLFGKLWGEIHCFDKLDKKTQKEMQAKMGPFYGLQLLMTALTTIVLAKLIVALPSYSSYFLATLSWIGFIVPTQAAAVIFGGTEQKWMAKKFGVMAGGSLACLLVAALILSMMR